MQIPVLVEPMNGNGFQARGAELSAQGATRDEALRNLHEQIQSRIRQGAEIVPLEVGVEPHPLAEFAGMFKDDPWIADWKESMAEHRRKFDEGPELP